MCRSSSFSSSLLPSFHPLRLIVRLSASWAISLIPRLRPKLRICGLQRSCCLTLGEGDLLNAKKQLGAWLLGSGSMCRGAICTQTKRGSTLTQRVTHVERRKAQNHTHTNTNTNCFVNRKTSDQGKRLGSANMKSHEDDTYKWEKTPHILREPSGLRKKTVYEIHM